LAYVSRRDTQYQNNTQNKGEKMTSWHSVLLPLLKEHSLMSPSQLARAVRENGGTATRQVAWKWLHGGLSAPGNIIPLCRTMGLKAHSTEEGIFIRSWAQAQFKQMQNTYNIPQVADDAEA
tara:strand:+ start:82 stop:444 length:363 start_codon:yes stop_codon:yes gene_type:complete